jgi:hypothetical protein
VHADCASWPLGRAVSLAHSRRHRHRRGVAGVEHPVRIRARSEGGRAPDPRAYTLSQSALSPVALLLTRDLMEEPL